MKDLAAWLTLRHCPRLGTIGIHNLLLHFGDAKAVCNAARSDLQTFNLSTSSIDFLKSTALSPSVEKELIWAEQAGNRILVCTDAEYPPLLKSIHSAPALLYVQGQISVLRELQLAMVGSRNPSAGGVENAFQFARHLAASGLVITSGLAVGIDAASHRGALAAHGATIAVMATGIDKVYPAEHLGLVEQILQRGAIVTEFPLGTPPLPEHFPQRNRIISGLSAGTLVVEAALRSGSLITARHALEQSREVFAIPGSIHNPHAKGCHQLIRQGAKLVESSGDILEELAPQLRTALNAAEPSSQSHENTISGLSEDYQQLLEAMGHDPITIDNLSLRSQMPPEAVSSMLLILELQGYIASQADGRYSRIS